MWTRGQLKDSAKDFLKREYWKALLVCLIFMVAKNILSSKIATTNIVSILLYGNFSLGAFCFSSFIIFILSLLISCLFEVGCCKFFVEAVNENSKIENVFFSFNGSRFQNILLTMAIKEVYIFLWSLLLIIPGIVKRYAYKMVPYILAENPNMDLKEAINLSVKMAEGEKFNMFVLDLSFIGWYILGSLAFGFGVLFVIPYHKATYAQLYFVLKEKRIEYN